MTTLMEFIVAQSSLPVGNTVSDHILNPGGTGTGGGGDVYIGSILHADVETSNLSQVTSGSISSNITTSTLSTIVSDVLSSNIDDYIKTSEIININEATVCQL